MKQNIQGIFVCLLIALPAWFLGQWFPVVGGPVFAILIGICLSRLVKGHGAFAPGIQYTSKKILQYRTALRFPNAAPHLEGMVKFFLPGKIQYRAAASRFFIIGAKYHTLDSCIDRSTRTHGAWLHRYI